MLFPSFYAEASVYECKEVLQHKTSVSPLEELHPTVKKWVMHRTSEAYPKLEKALVEINQKIVVDGESVKVIGFLGAGHEGQVYLVQTSQSLVALKMFYSAFFMLEWVEYFDKRPHLNGPQVSSIDEDKSAILYEYIEGIPADAYTNEDIQQDLGLSSETILDINIAWKTRENRYSGIQNFNQVYIFRTKSVRPIDTHY